MEYFKRLEDLLKLEKEEDKLQYQLLTEKSTAAVRRENGLTWFPVAIKGTEMTQGDYICVEVEKTSHFDIPHQLRAGMPAAFFTNHDPLKDRVEGNIVFLQNNRLKITLYTDDLPEWSRDGKLGIDLLFDDNSYDEMFQALKNAQTLEKGNTAKLRDILTGNSKVSVNQISTYLNSDSLNESQNRAVNNILQAKEVAVVHGPPGTGKTTTLVQAIKALYQQDKQQILVCAPSNTAVDLLAEKLSIAGMNVLRVGNPTRVSERLQTLTLDYKIQEHQMYKDIRKFKKQAQEYKQMAQKYKRNFGPSEREQRKMLMNEANKLMKEAGNTEQYIVNDMLTKVQVIAATLVGSNNQSIRHLNFTTVIIDEAGQAPEPGCWIPILKAEKLILAGDHCQLPPTIKSNEAAKGGLSETLLEKIVKLHPSSVTLLEEQYRMNEQIMTYSSNVFYGGKLKANHSVAKHILFDGESPLEMVDTAGCGFEEKIEGTSISNPEEANLLFKHLEALHERVSNHFSINDYPEIAIIAPYKQQVITLKEQLANHPLGRELKEKIQINTVDSFQGQERDIVYISMTRSNDKSEIGFLADIRRMNVAMTRARKKLVIIGDSATLAVHPFYENFIKYAENQDAYKSAWEWM